MTLLSPDRGIAPESEVLHGCQVMRERSRSVGQLRTC
jgi:hypothetical protein